jgi:uncharacterized paraquat-inducible protein A
MNAREPAVCAHCRHAFEPPARLAGGIANCPRCGRAVEVPGLRDPMWRVLQAVVAAAAVAVTLVMAQYTSPAPAVVAGALVLAGAWLLSRVL